MNRNALTYVALGVLGIGFMVGMVKMNRKAMNRKAWVAAGVASNANDPLAGARQVLVATTPDWRAVNGAMQRYERKTLKSQWQPVGSAIPIVVGRNGLAWGRGLHRDAETLAQPTDPRKREGDGKAPAGIFKLSSAFGYAAADPRIKLSYRQSRQMTQCVDDAQSARYNQLVERDRITKPDWKSYEDMRRKDEQYRWGVFVEHNSGAQRQPAGGSCIFLHIWAGANSGTAGCTAMEAALMEEVLYWLDPKLEPVIVQMPVKQLQENKNSLRLP